MSTFYFKYKNNNEFSKISSYSLGVNKNIKKLEIIDNYIIKAKKNNYKYFKIPFRLEDSHLIPEVYQSLKGNGLQLIIQSDFKKGLISYAHLELKNIPFEFIIDSELDHEELELFKAQINHLIDTETTFKIVIVVHRSLDISKLRVALKNYEEYICYYFSLNYNENSHYLSAKEIHKLLNENTFEFHSSPWQVLWDHRIPDDLELVPFYKPILSGKTIQQYIECSIIIPSFENKNYLVQVLNNLFELNYSKENFEIIIIDDGSNDGTYETMIKLLCKKENEYNFFYYYLPRFQRRVMGDARYRAGISRNFAKNMARGQYIFFLDSDIIVYKDYLIDNLNLLKEYDIVQSKRFDLTEECSRSSNLYEDIDVSSIKNRDQYWIDFHNNPKQWDEIEDKWKYLCTHSLCISKKTLDQFGNFETNFIYYGFEDTDLGYKLRDLKFKLNEKPVCHRFHQNSRSEFFNSKFIRKLLLARTAQIFFIIHLEKNIYQTFIDLMSSEFKIRSFLKRTLLRFKKRIFWSWPVFKS
jgi:glycosyltransferase involved in cell wall biosynthesis